MSGDTQLKYQIQLNCIEKIGKEVHFSISKIFEWIQRIH